MFRKIKILMSNVYLISIFAKILLAVFGFVYSIIVARYIGPSLKGQLAYINSIVGTAVIVFSLGVHQSYPYYKKQQLKDIKKIYVHATIILFVLYMSIAVAIICICGKMLERNIAIAILLIPISVFSKLITYLIMIESPNKKHLMEVVAEVIQLILLVFVYLFFEKSLIICIALIAVHNVGLSIYSLYTAHVSLRFEKKDVKMLGRFISFGIIPMISLLMNNLNYRIDILMLGERVHDAQIGIYSIGVSLAEKIWLLSDSMRDVLYSKLTTGKGTNETNKVMRISFSASLVVVIGLVLLGKPFISFCYGKEYSAAYIPMVIVLVGSLAMVYYKVIQAHNIVHHKQKQNLLFLSFSVAINIVLNIILIPLYGINGAALASLASYMACSIMFITYYLWLTKTHLLSILIINKEDIKSIKKLTAPK